MPHTGTPPSALPRTLLGNNAACDQSPKEAKSGHGTALGRFVLGSGARRLRDMLALCSGFFSADLAKTPLCPHALRWWHTVLRAECLCPLPEPSPSSVA